MEDLGFSNSARGSEGQLRECEVCLAFNKWLSTVPIIIGHEFISPQVHIFLNKIV